MATFFFLFSFFLLLFNLIGNNPLFSNLRSESGAVVASLKLESARRLTFADQQPKELSWHSWMQTSSAVNIVCGEWNSTATSLLFNFAGCFVGRTESCRICMMWSVSSNASSSIFCRWLSVVLEQQKCWLSSTAEWWHSALLEAVWSCTGIN